MAEALGELLAICRKSKSFGRLLYDLLIERDVSQKELSYKINRSKSDVSRLVNDDIPDAFEIHDVEQIAKSLECGDLQLAILIRSFACHVLRSRGLW
ncbi:MAG TPA: helix-turn-helix domain-containing protein [Aggregatilineales bacterium]|nr:helix-turn-helix domain-containing protein [Aggregatilineales bacterium]